jgi:phage terminase small subunit
VICVARQPKGQPGFHLSLPHMPVLSNARHERFAQATADGLKGKAAFLKAGFPNGPGASVSANRLRNNAKIGARINELLLSRERIAAHGFAKAIEKTAISKEYVLSRLKENVERAMQYEAPKDGVGNIIGYFEYEGSVANRALELLGKELGMFIERTENKTEIYTISNQPLTEEEWAAQRAEPTSH